MTKEEQIELLLKVVSDYQKWLGRKDKECESLKNELEAANRQLRKQSTSI